MITSQIEEVNNIVDTRKALSKPILSNCAGLGSDLPDVTKYFHFHNVFLHSKHIFAKHFQPHKMFFLIQNISPEQNVFLHSKHFTRTKCYQILSLSQKKIVIQNIYFKAFSPSKKYFPKTFTFKKEIIYFYKMLFCHTKLSQQKPKKTLHTKCFLQILCSLTKCIFCIIQNTFTE